MGLFSKKEKKLLLGLGEKNVDLCKEAVKELEELYADLKTAYEEIDNVAEEFVTFATTVTQKLEKNEQAKLTTFAKKLGKAEKCARDAVRDVHDVLRTQKKRLKEAQRELI
ncbi:hypothetical protein [Flavobacterium subsaxonicum]|uniref:Uncharacterized protein n=1 Tax=Flavobacterium subsaxonicum WB 4.1-42 = DSM 21790 TaxID=1121898 RepID=A0A0A2MK37_9FLAO|nr:hypothetical protein [Flavobacterium subsaxonicum]KGO91961.1 hypothetical protein Q766_15060 [Flavobacterium subsaxonicum WB 4.1-42 = DSM 21790]